jgi:hypothetical protein
VKPRSFLLPLLLFLAASSSQSQTAVDRRLDSVMRSRDELFGVRVPDSLDEDAAQRDTASRFPHTWYPEFSPRFGRRDLLGLRDRHFLLTYDRADGLFLGAGADIPRSLFEDTRMQGHVGFGYAFGSHYWQVSGGARYDLLDVETPLRLSAEGHILTDTRDAWKMDVVENTLYAALAGGDARDYFQRRGFSVGIEKYLLPRVSIAAEYRHDRYRSSRREVGWSLFGPEQPFREVPPVADAALRSFAFTLQADYLSLRSWSEPQFGIAIEAELGSGEDRPDDLEKSLRTFDMQSFVVDARLKTAVIPGVLWLALRARAGATTSDGETLRDGLPQRWFTIGGVGTLPGFPDNEFAGNRMLLVNTDLLFRPIASGIGRNLRIIVSNDAGAVSVAGPGDRDDPFTIGPASISDWKYSTGIYLGAPAARFRIGVAWRTDRMESPRFVMRLSETF